MGLEYWGPKLGLKEGQIEAGMEAATDGNDEPRVVTADGKTDPNRAFGPNPTGLIHYDAKGYMAVDHARSGTSQVRG